MSNQDTELEEGEITDSDSEAVEQKPVPASKPPTYSIFDSQPSSAVLWKSVPRPPHSESDSSNSDSDDDNDDNEDGLINKRKCRRGQGGAVPSEQFVNPNFVSNGGSMPPLPKQSNKSIWGSVLQEQILTAEVGSFSMEKKVPSYRDVESYDYTRAKEDDRPFVVEEEMNHAEEDLFGEVIDLEKSALKQQRTLKRKHVGARLGKRNPARERLDLPKVTENSSVEEVTYFISKKLQEAKVHLIRRVVQCVGQAKALALLKKTEEVEAAGGMMTMNGSRRRTPGGVYLMLLKNDAEVTKEQMDEIFEEENKWSMEMKKRKKARARRRKQERDQQKSKAAAPEDKGDNPASMEVTAGEDNHSRSSMEGLTGSPKNHADHLSDTQESCGGRERQDSDGSHSSDDRTSDAEEQDFQSQLTRELKRQAEARQAKEAEGGAEGVTVDDILDIGVDEDFLD